MKWVIRDRGIEGLAEPPAYVCRMPDGTFAIKSATHPDWTPEWVVRWDSKEEAEAWLIGWTLARGGNVDDALWRTRVFDRGLKEFPKEVLPEDQVVLPMKGAKWLGRQL